MRMPTILLCLVAVVALTGCPRKRSNRNFTGNGGGTTPTQPPAPQPPVNPNPPNGTPDPTKENTAFVTPVFSPGSSTQVSLGFSLIGTVSDPNDLKKKGSLPPAGYRFRGRFDYNDAGGNARFVEIEASTLSPANLTPGSRSVEVHPTNPNIRFKLEVIEGLPNTGQAPTVVETPISSTPITPQTGNLGFSLGFDLTVDPQQVP